VLDRENVTVQCVCCDARIGVRISDAGDIPTFSCQKCGTQVPDYFVAIANVAGFRAELSQLASAIGNVIATAVPDKADRLRVAEIAEQVAHPHSGPAVDVLVAALRRHAASLN
jgi:hypothetical protein